jgi:hypothetical protein
MNVRLIIGTSCALSWLVGCAGPVPGPGEVSGGKDTAADGDGVSSVQVALNEVAPSGNPDGWVELVNLGAAPVDAAGWIIGDANIAHLYVLPAGTTLAAGAYLVVSETDLGFGIGQADTLVLEDGAGHQFDSVSWVQGDAPGGTSYARIPNGTGKFQTSYEPTPGAANATGTAPACGNAEVDWGEACDGSGFGSASCEGYGYAGGKLTCADQCKRIDPTGCTLTPGPVALNEVSAVDDWIELANLTGDAVDLGGWEVYDQSVDKAQEIYRFESGTTLPAGSYLVMEKGVHHTYGLGSDDELYLRNPEKQLVDRTDWPDGGAAISWCRDPDKTGAFGLCEKATLGKANPAQVQP